MGQAEQVHRCARERERLRGTIRMIDEGRLTEMFRPMGGPVESRAWEYRCHIEGLIDDLDRGIEGLELAADEPPP